MAAAASGSGDEAAGGARGACRVSVLQVSRRRAARPAEKRTPQLAGVLLGVAARGSERIPQCPPHPPR